MVDRGMHEWVQGPLQGNEQRKRHSIRSGLFSASLAHTYAYLSCLESEPYQPNLLPLFRLFSSFFPKEQIFSSLLIFPPLLQSHNILSIANLIVFLVILDEYYLCRLDFSPTLRKSEDL